MKSVIYALLLIGVSLVSNGCVTTAPPVSRGANDGEPAFPTRSRLDRQEDIMRMHRDNFQSTSRYF